MRRLLALGAVAASLTACGGDQPPTLGVLDCRACGQTAHWCDCATRQPWAV